MEIDSGQNIRDVGSGDIQLGQQFDFAASNTRVNVQFSSNDDEILLQYLQRYDASSRTSVLGNQIESATLLRRCSFVVGVHENIGIEEATGAHEFRFD